MPAQNEPPAPVKIATERAGSASSRSIASARPRLTAALTAFLAFGSVDGDDQDPVALFDQDFGVAFAHDAVTLLLVWVAGALPINAKGSARPPAQRRG